MNTEEIINYLAPFNSSEYHCYDALRHLLDTNENFKNIIETGISSGLIHGFSDTLWIKLSEQNIRSLGIDSFLDVLRDGANIGYCTVASKQVSYSLDNCEICGGVLPLIAGTKNSFDGTHTWIETNNSIIDTTLMLEIDKSLKFQIGYIEENKYNPNLDANYTAAKDFANDISLRKGKKIL